MEKIPQTVGVIMDGNRRWAKANGLQVFLGHENGYKTLRELLDWAKEVGVKNVVAFAFSEENWGRSEDEVAYLLDLMRKIFSEGMKEIIANNIRVKFAGNLSKFPEDIVADMKKIEKDSKKNTDFNLVLCLSYGGRQEITECCNKLLKEGKKEITAEDISKNIYTCGIPDPDIIIRTSGEQRLSGFLLWQSAYSELFFTKTLWPDFSKKEFLEILREYSDRERRMGR